MLPCPLPVGSGWRHPRPPSRPFVLATLGRSVWTPAADAVAGAAV